MHCVLTQEVLVLSSSKIALGYFERRLTLLKYEPLSNSDSFLGTEFICEERGQNLTSFNNQQELDEKIKLIDVNRANFTAEVMYFLYLGGAHRQGVAFPNIEPPAATDYVFRDGSSEGLTALHDQLNWGELEPNDNGGGERCLALTVFNYQEDFTFELNDLPCFVPLDSGFQDLGFVCSNFENVDINNKEIDENNNNLIYIYGVGIGSSLVCFISLSCLLIKAKLHQNNLNNLTPELDFKV